MINIVYTELTIAFGTAVVGILSLFVTLRARGKLSKGMFKDYTNYYMSASLLLLGFAAWKIIQKMFGLISFKHIYTEYALLALVFIAFALSSRKLFLMSKMFGFSEKTKNIEKILKQKSGSKSYSKSR